MVAHCSTMVWAIGERRTSAGDCVPNTMKAFCLRMVLSPSWARPRKASSPSAFQNSSMSITRRRPSTSPATRWNRYIITGVRTSGVEHVGHVEAEEPGVEAEGVLLVVEHPAERPPRHHRSQPGADALASRWPSKARSAPNERSAGGSWPRARNAGIDPLLLGRRSAAGPQA